ncbi:hypothetical protein [Nocardioides alkalitolerans]|uniref:hypothetical protein n=1 Tax=Nocardioides alkalitolerans TaxID=281714 RepID=UPI000422AA16|nr:hypothetical protein [Nocardioides alkalitolerans]
MSTRSIPPGPSAPTRTTVRGPLLRRAAHGLAVAALGLAALSGCSSEEPAAAAEGEPVAGAGVDDSPAAAQRFAGLPADSIAAAALADMADVRSLQARVRTTHDGLEVEADVAVDGESDCVGTVRVGDGSVEVLRIGGLVYARFDQPLLEALGHGTIAAAAIVERTADRWVALDVASGLTDVALACQAAVEALGGQIFAGGTDSSAAALEVGPLETLAGTHVVQVSRTSDLGTTTAWVGAAGDHRYVQVLAPRDGRALVVDQLVYDAPVTVPDPDERGVVPSSEVGLS